MASGSPRFERGGRRSAVSFERTILALTIDYYMEMAVQWADCTGNIAERWPLQSFLGTRDDIAFFETNNAESQRALIEIIPSASEGTAAIRKSWKLASVLETPGLLKLHETGDTEVGGVPVAYAVLTLPDDDIGEILPRRKLTMEEARVVVASAAGALAYLHGRGLRHGAVTPSNLFVTGNEVKLGVDTIVPAGDDGRAEDLRQFGTTLTEALTGSRDPAAARGLPAPFAEIAQGCLESAGRDWTANRILLALRGEKAKPPIDETPVAVLTTPPETTKRRWPLAVAALIAVIAVLGYWLGRPVHREQVAEPAPPLAIQATTPAPENKPSPIDMQRLQPPPPPVEKRDAAPKGSATASVERSTQPARPSVEQQADRQTSGPPAGSWAVIAAAYASFSAAQRRASKIERVLTSANPHVFPAEGQGTLYYVVIGSGMTQAEAVRLRDRAVKSGAPHDSYVTKLKE